MNMTDKGTKFENLVMFRWLKAIWHGVHRWGKANGPNDVGDFGNVGFRLIEAKHRKTWALPAWIRDIEDKSDKLMDGARWEIVFAGDRKKRPNGVYVCLPASVHYRDQYELHLFRQVHPYEDYTEALDDMERERE